MKTTYTQPLSDATVSLEKVGGKGLSLSRMIQAGFPVPDGFHLTTAAYVQFVTANHLQGKILNALKGVDVAHPATLEDASATIGQLFAEATMPDEVVSAIAESYASLPTRDPSPAAVAVRSSATAEDLPEASFAGQQETYLNIRGVEALLAAVQQCWASLWTARAIAYRLRNNIDQQTVALAVVVQEMVAAEASGVVFTANPVNGRRDEMVINAAWGLGETIVGGLVSPDTIVVDKATGKIKSVEVAEKTIISVRAERGTRQETLQDDRRYAQVLTKAQVSELAGLARTIETYYGSPQDIEWCYAGERLYILQARPVTALPAVGTPGPVDWKLPKGAYALMRNNIVELMANPLSPLFATLGVSTINRSFRQFLTESFAMDKIMPDELILVVNQYAYNNGSVSAMGMVRMFIGIPKILRMMFTGAVERWTENARPRYHQTVETWGGKNWRVLSSTELVNTARQLMEAAIEAYIALVSGVIPAAWITEAIFTHLYNRLIKRRQDPKAATYLLGYDSLPIRADQSLFNLAEWARHKPELAATLEHTPTPQLVHQCQHAHAPGDRPTEVWQEWCSRFLQHQKAYGHMLYDLDFINPVPADDPTPVLEALKFYLGGNGTNPTTRQEGLAAQRQQAVAGTQQRLKGLRLKWFNKTLASAQKYAPMREDGLAEVGLAYPLIRRMLCELGHRFAQQKIIPTPEDIFWLTEGEVESTAARLDAGQPVESLSGEIPGRKATHQAALRLTPPMALPQMKIFGFDLMSLKGKGRRSDKGDVIKGVAASPGRVTGCARVLHDPDDFSRMEPGDVLVAAITTPAWTPLFAMASAVVTDVGGPLSHGSIVAREYGIPAVLGTGVATRRIQDGQTVTVDGSAGKVTLVNEEGTRH